MTYRFNTISIRIPAGFFGHIDKLDTKIHMEIQGAQRVKTMLKENNRLEENILILKSTVISMITGRMLLAEEWAN